jgi:ribosome biogenesis protein BMS1
MSNLSDVLGKPNKKHSSKVKGKGKKKSAEPPQKGKKNHRAFGVTNIVSAKRILQRNLDKQQQKEVVPLTSREETIPPPTLIVVMGPKGVGKTTLIRSLVKIYTGQNMTDCNGPITVIAGQKKRLTFFECPLDLYSMTDLAKIADLVILMIDASYGLEMETFEFLNLLQLHGFPKVCGLLTNLDKFRNIKTLQKTKKEIKHRFWTEIFKGAKLFELMGVINNKYRKHEVKRLSLYISRVKFRPLVWRNTHPYLLIDRIEDVTPAAITANGASSSLVKKNKNNSKGGRGFGNHDDYDDEEDEAEEAATSSLSLNKGEKEVTLYGYIRGSHLKTTTKVHLLGCGDFDISSITALPDPCPLKHDEGSREGAKLKLSRKKDHLLYAPMANVGRVTIDQTGDLYIDLKHIHYSKKDQLYLPDQQTLGNQEGREREDYDEYDHDDEGMEGTPMDLLRSMQDVKVGLDQQLKKSRGELHLFADGSGANNDNYDNDEYDDDDGDGDDDEVEEEEEGDYDENDDDDENADEEDYDEEQAGLDEDDDEENEILEENDEDDDSDNDDGDDSENDDAEDEEEAHAGSMIKRSSSSFSSQQQQNMKKNMMNSLLSSGPSGASSVTYSSDMNQFNDIMKQVYGNTWVHTSSGKKKDSSKTNGNHPVGLEEEEEGEEDFFVFKGRSGGSSSSSLSNKKNAYYEMNKVDSSRYWAYKPAFSFLSSSSSYAAGGSSGSSSGSPSPTSRVSPSEIIKKIHRGSSNYHLMKARFVTGAAAARKGGEENDEDNEDEGENDDGGDSEVAEGELIDLEDAGNDSGNEFDAEEEEEAGGSFNVLKKKRGKPGKKRVEDFEEDNEEDDDDQVNSEEEQEAMNERIDQELRQLNAQKKAMFKMKFDSEYDHRRTVRKAFSLLS